MVLTNRSSSLDHRALRCSIPMFKRTRPLLIKCTLALVALALVPVSSSAQQSGSKKSADNDSDCEEEKWRMFRSLCRELEQRNKDLQLAVEKANDLKKAADDVQKLQSTDKDQQIDGVVGVGKDLNSQGNSNPASREVTDKSLSFIDKVAHWENKILDNVDNAIRTGFQPQTVSPSPFTPSEQHQLNEATGIIVGQQQLTPEQRREVQEQTEKMFDPYVNATVETNRAIRAAAQANDYYPAEQRTSAYQPTEPAGETAGAAASPRGYQPQTSTSPPPTATYSTGSPTLTGGDSSANTGTKSVGGISSSIKVWRCEIQDATDGSVQREQFSFKPDGTYTGIFLDDNSQLYTFDDVDKWEQTGNDFSWVYNARGARFKSTITGNSMSGEMMFWGYINGVLQPEHQIGTFRCTRASKK
jgi:hypothetical protein